MAERRLEISDHAVLRWLERVEGVDVAAIRRRILAACRAGAEHGAGGVALDGVHFSIRYHDDGRAVVTTTWSAHQRRHLAEPRREAGR